MWVVLMLNLGTRFSAQFVFGKRSNAFQRISHNEGAKVRAQLTRGELRPDLIVSRWSPVRASEAPRGSSHTGTCLFAAVSFTRRLFSTWLPLPGALRCCTAKRLTQI